jgi:hypothetical protein
LRTSRGRGACWDVWHARCLCEVFCSIEPGVSFSIHCTIVVCRLLSA